MKERTPNASAFSLTSDMPLNTNPEYGNRKTTCELACPSKEISLTFRNGLCGVVFGNYWGELSWG